VAYISLEALSILISPSHDAERSSRSFVVKLICICRKLSDQKYRIELIARPVKGYFEKKVSEILKF
jgi:hypothetical protein